MNAFWIAAVTVLCVALWFGALFLGACIGDLTRNQLIWLGRRLAWLIGLRCRECYVLPWHKRTVVRCEQVRGDHQTHSTEDGLTGWDTGCGHRLA